MQVRKAKKLLPFDQKLFDSWPGRSKKMDAARNVPRQGGFGGGGAYQKINKNIPSADLSLQPLLGFGRSMFHACVLAALSSIPS